MTTIWSTGSAKTKGPRNVEAIICFWAFPPADSTLPTKAAAGPAIRAGVDQITINTPRADNLMSALSSAHYFSCCHLWSAKQPAAKMA